MAAGLLLAQAPGGWAEDGAGELPEAGALRAEAQSLADAYVAAFTERVRLEGGNRFLERELERLGGAGRSDSPLQLLLADLRRLDAPEAGALTELLRLSAEPVVESLDTAGAELGYRASELVESWRQLRAVLNYGQLELFRVERGSRVAGQLASLLSVDKRWFWLFGVVATGTLLAVILHDRRHELRRFFNGGRPRAMGLSKIFAVALIILILLTAVTFLMGDRIYESLLSVGSEPAGAPHEAMTVATERLEEQIGRLRQERADMEAAYRSQRARWEELFAEGLPSGALPVRWSALRSELLELAEWVALLEELPGAIQRDLAALEQVNRELAAQTELRAEYLRLRQWIRGGLGLVLMGLTAIGGCLFRRGVSRRRWIISHTCPLCLGVNRLEPVGGRSRRRRGLGRAGMLQCRNVISQDPYEECDYRFMA
ncbi:MAG TPA: hypothetical protein EYP56_14655, partial [Planctomycetaceae bacterium]|nr:hypothetical protein [Planctomycetaceae bacterium]